MADKQAPWDATRVFILVIVVVFFISSFAVSAMVLYELTKGDDSAKEATTSETKDKPKEGQLQGTKLADFTPIDNVTELQKIDLKPGEGAEVKAGDTVTAHYTGAVASTGVIFQSSLDMGQPATFPLGGVIKGWQEGVPGMKVGGKRRLIIPAELAYGTNPPPGSGIEANADLVFDIELVKIGE